MSTFKAIVVDKSEAGQTVRLTDFDEKDLMDGDVTVAVDWSTVNYKDGLAVTGKSPVVRRFPMVAGIDFAGTVEASSHPGWKPGDKVILNGWGVRRDPPPRLCGEGAGQGRLAGAATGQHERPRSQGHRHRRLYRHAVGDGAGACRDHARARAGHRHRRRRRRRLGCDRARPSSATPSSARPGGPPKPPTSRTSAPPR